MGIKQASTRAEAIQSPSGSALGGWSLVASFVASSDATIDVIDLSSDFVYKFFWYGTQPSTDERFLWIRTSTDNGASFDAGGSDYAWVNQRISFQTAPLHSVDGDNADSEINFNTTTSMGNLSTQVSDYEITCFNPSDTGYTKFKWEGSVNNGDITPVRYLFTGAGVRLSAAAVNGVRFLYSTGNVLKGTLKVYAIKA